VGTRYSVSEKGVGVFDLSERQLIEALRDHVFSDRALVIPMSEATQAQMRAATERLERKALAHHLETQQRTVRYLEAKAEVDARRRERERLALFYQSMNQPLVDRGR
jgi:predicted DCC family thiol-disulfide oxidoreductase YuxK